MRINERLEIDDGELTYVYSRSPGPGGQNVNKVETKVTLRFDVASSPSLSTKQRQLILEALATRITRNGVLLVSSHRHRTRGANQKAVSQRFTELLQQALAERQPRRRTRVPARVRRQRLRNKLLRSRLKKLRSQPDAWGE